MTVHNMMESLAKADAQADAPWWHDVYSRAFPGFSQMMVVRNDGWAQRGGIDRVIVLKSGKHVTVDEKVRERCWNDILLERWSDNKRKTPGWIQKSLACDFIAYAFVPDRRCYVFPFIQLRAAWIANGGRWIELAERQEQGFKTILADNGSYVTESVAVPIPELLSALHAAQVIDWDAA